MKRMDPIIISHFKIYLKKDKNKRTFISEKWLENNKIKKFCKPYTEGYPKIYMVKHNNEILYIGFTVDSIGNRLRNGLSPGKLDKISNKIVIGKDGYHGYKWKDLDVVDYYVWVYKQSDMPVKDEVKLMFENIEAEMVYLYKQTTGFWPKYQSEIHFYAKLEKQNPAICEDYFNMSTTDLASKLFERKRRRKG